MSVFNWDPVGGIVRASARNGRQTFRDAACLCGKLPLDIGREVTRLSRVREWRVVSYLETARRIDRLPPAHYTGSPFAQLVIPGQD